MELGNSHSTQRILRFYGDQIMKKFTTAALVSTIFLGAAPAYAATASADAFANILEEVVVTKTADLNFGTIVVGATGDTVSVSTAGVVSCGTLVCSGTTAAAAFGVTGTVGETVTVTVDPSVTLTSGANTMTATLTSSDTTLTLAGADSFTVGGDLAVGNAQASGVYSGTFDVTVNY